MNVNELRTKLTNIQISFKEVKDQIAFSNAEVKFMTADLSVEDVVYEEGLVKLKPIQEGKVS